MGRARYWRMLALAVALPGLLALAACRGEVPRPPPPAPPPGPLSVPPGAGPLRAPEADAPAGIYFLHEPGFPMQDCDFIGEHQTGAALAQGQRRSEQARARAVLDMAEQARSVKGNVVLLPNFRDDFRAGRLVGQIYRCDEEQRRTLYDRGAATYRLTVVPP